MMYIKNNSLTFVLVLCLILGSCKDNKVDKQVTAFMQDLTAPSPNYDQLINKYLCELPSEGQTKYIVELQLKALNNALKEKAYKISEYERESKLLTVDSVSTDQIYSIGVGDEVITYVVTNNNKKVISISTMNKGKQKIPLMICK